MLRDDSTPKIEVVNICGCAGPIKEYSKSGCYSCWVCGRCGRFGGCDNSRAMAEAAGITGLIIIEKPKPPEPNECEDGDHHYHIVENGEVKTSWPCWYQVACCKCHKGNYMATELIGCKMKFKKNDMEFRLGPALKGKLFRKEE